MPDPASFDEFYLATRSRLLLQTYALTGDLPAARGAVRDAFAAVWHHWRKVSRLDDPESWVRPVAWTHAQRRSTARIWHRDKSLDEDTRATLDALARLSHDQRRILLLVQLCRVTMAGMAREVGMTDEAAARELQTATSQFSLHRGVPATSIRAHLEALAPRTAETRLPRVTVVRRAGSARRRTHTAVGMALVAGLTVLVGTLVHDPSGIAVALHRITPVDDEQSAEPPPRLHEGDLLARGQLTRLAPKRNVRTVRTHDGTAGSGRYFACQPERFADPRGLSALVRQVRYAGKPTLSATQSVELSTSRPAAHAALRRMVGWFGACDESRVQLLSSHRIDGVGDEGRLLVLRAWDDPVTTYSVALVRTGKVVTAIARRERSDHAPALDPMLDATVAATRSLCDLDQAGACPRRRARLVAVPPPSPPQARGLLQTVDLPPISGVRSPWAATRPKRPRTNSAATSCDEADFTVKPIRSARTRTFVVPEAKLSNAFGITETVGRFRKPAAAQRFADDISGRMAGCEKKDLATEVTRPTHESDRSGSLSIWTLNTEISENRTIRYQMALVRRGPVVVQVGFVPDPDKTLPPGGFEAIVRRARERLENLPRR